MDFRLLHVRLIAHLQHRVHNGEVTERSLARLSGISQPHLHNVLKGARSLSPDLADQILRCLHIDLLDLAPDAPKIPGSLECWRFRTIACLEGVIGPQHPFPARESRLEAYPFPAADLDGLESPVAVRLAPDPRMADLFTGGDLILLDRSETRRMIPDEEGYYALDIGGASAVRRVRVGGRILYPMLAESCPKSGARASHDPHYARPVSLIDRSLLQLVRGRVARLVRCL